MAVREGERLLQDRHGGLGGGDGSVRPSPTAAARGPRAIVFMSCPVRTRVGSGEPADAPRWYRVRGVGGSGTAGNGRCPPRDELLTVAQRRLPPGPDRIGAWIPVTTFRPR